MIPAASGLLAAEAITRDGAREAAERELDRAVYDEAQPSLTVRVITWVIEHIQELLGRASSATPGGGFGLLVLVLVLAVVVVTVVRLGPLRRARSADAGLDVPTHVTAAQLRADADAAARDGRYADAVRARFRAVVRTLEDRTIIEPRLGRTATEVARDASVVAPPLRVALDAGAATFSEIWYGGRKAGPDDLRVVVELDDALARYRPGRTPSSAPGPGTPAVPA